jgi:hypothetical protein
MLYIFNIFNTYYTYIMYLKYLIIVNAYLILVIFGFWEKNVFLL